MDYSEFFSKAAGFEPFPYQARLAEASWPDTLNVPTGLGKTAAVTLAWLYKRRELRDEATPRRLIWCLPMRVLVEQTVANIEGWLKALDLSGRPGEGKVSVNVLMGGEEDIRKAEWTSYPEDDAILVGTQDMLLSRALMRGYGMSRYQWPIHFALLHNDACWVFDEVQLMGAGLATSAQLEAFRRDFPLAKNSRTLWVSATLNRDWLDTVDLHRHMDSLTTRAIGNEDRRQAGDRLRAVKSIAKAPVSLSKDAGNKAGLQTYLENLCNLVLEAHDTRAQTLVILNRVERAQQLFRLLCDSRPDKADLLIHARFRAAERTEQARRLHDENGADRIIVATQAIEAGVDISSKTLVTELAPWASMVQRFGRCNRYGENNQDGARILWLDIEDEADVLPYTHEALATARGKLNGLASASPQDLPAVEETRPLTSVPRRKDLLDLFNTDPDLSGFDVDVSDYIRDTGTPGVQVFWRDFKDDPNTPDIQGRADRRELCPVSIGQAMEFTKRKDTMLWRWDALDEHWTKLARDPRPGMVLLLRAADGGYDEAIGFDGALKKPPVPVISVETRSPHDAMSEDWRSQQPKPVALPEHLGHVARHAAELCAKVNETAHTEVVVIAGRWHDLGKAHAIFQKSMYRCKGTIDDELLAKSDCPGPMRHKRPYFRHELASMLAWLDQQDGDERADLVAYLIAAHHGKVRMSLRAMPTEEAADGVKRFARGVWEGDTLPALDFDGEHSRETTLKLTLMEIGEGEQGPSWTERTLKLLDHHGPFRLAWLETLVRLADWRASAEEQKP
ncbi:CRISPR-associated helicase/endonuclease Cas3 [Thioalkalivibrio thiocyanodenitrificans]|uniref:CRISPR-associated helicase/endonuclease Cas3 n=1 Tax=Thioalkalivibrio thiocyanodenitrificans TaxID=243063 RepID=UPI00037B8B6E|nr:CRISPR-associated helicase/endonuclease Cas3 [Thioalkalivibrio thiocyanodenitrificans]